LSKSQIISFILRFTQEAPTDSPSTTHPWRAMIRHVQSDEQLNFTCMDEALAFMRRYLNLEAGEAEGQPLKESDE
jgi:carbonic anhydrase